MRDSAAAGEKGQGPFQMDPSTAIFQIGNDKLVLLLSTFGHAQVNLDFRLISACLDCLRSILGCILPGY